MRNKYLSYATGESQSAANDRTSLDWRDVGYHVRAGQVIHHQRRRVCGLRGASALILHDVLRSRLVVGTGCRDQASVGDSGGCPCSARTTLMIFTAHSRIVSGTSPNSVRSRELSIR
jgi:hypothetical protein